MLVAPFALLDVGVIFEGPKVGRSKTYRLNEQFGWKGTVTNHKRHSKTALVSFRAAGFKEPAAGGQSTEHCMQFLVDCLSSLLFCRLKIPCVFCSPISRTTEPPRFRQRLERNRKPSGETPDPHRCNTDGLRPPTNQWLLVPCKWALQGAGAVPGDLKAPGWGIGAPDLLKRSVSVFAPSMP